MKLNNWKDLSLSSQMANIGSEVERTIIWQSKNKKVSDNAFLRCLDLLDLTLASHIDFPKLKEVARTREILVDYFLGENQYSSSQKSLQKYFYQFNVKARENN